jgi:hypothetical protein
MRFLYPGHFVVPRVMLKMRFGPFDGRVDGGWRKTHQRKVAGNCMLWTMDVEGEQLFQIRRRKYRFGRDPYSHSSD